MSKDEDADRILSEYIENIPAPHVVRARICENYREAKLLRQLLKISEQKASVDEAKQGADDVLPKVGGTS